MTRCDELTESTEQQCLIRWAAYNLGRWPCLALLYHIPNEGMRSRATGARMQAEGLRKGVPDLCLPVARGGYHGLYIELKRQRGGVLSHEQAEWIDRLTHEGYMAVCCHGWEKAAETITKYLEGKTA